MINSADCYIIHSLTIEHSKVKVKFTCIGEPNSNIADLYFANLGSGYVK